MLLAVEWLNYHHLLYFWTAAREGGVTRAAKKLRLSQPTVSEQIKRLEELLGNPLFERASAARLVLTEFGRTIYGYADEIFALGRELMDAAKTQGAGRPRRLVVGVADVLPKLIVYRLLEPALRLGIELVCREDYIDQLLAGLSIHEVDLVLSDSPVGPNVGVRGVQPFARRKPRSALRRQGCKRRAFKRGFFRHRSTANAFVSRSSKPCCAVRSGPISRRQRACIRCSLCRVRRQRAFGDVALGQATCRCFQRPRRRLERQIDSRGHQARGDLVLYEQNGAPARRHQREERRWRHPGRTPPGRRGGQPASWSRPSGLAGAPCSATAGIELQGS